MSSVSYNNRGADKILLVVLFFFPVRVSNNMTAMDVKCLQQVHFWLTITRCQQQTSQQFQEMELVMCLKCERLFWNFKSAAIANLTIWPVCYLQLEVCSAVFMPCQPRKVVSWCCCPRNEAVYLESWYWLWEPPGCGVYRWFENTWQFQCAIFVCRWLKNSVNVYYS